MAGTKIARRIYQWDKFPDRISDAIKVIKQDRHEALGDVLWYSQQAAVSEAAGDMYAVELERIRHEDALDRAELTARQLDRQRRIRLLVARAIAEQAI